MVPQPSSLGGVADITYYTTKVAEGAHGPNNLKYICQRYLIFETMD